MQEVNAFHQTLFNRTFTQMDGHLDDGLPGKHPVGHTHLPREDSGEHDS
jgi:hypothetical protein